MFTAFCSIVYYLRTKEFNTSNSNISSILVTCQRKYIQCVLLVSVENAIRVFLERLVCLALMGDAQNSVFDPGIC